MIVMWILVTVLLVDANEIANEIADEIAEGKYELDDSEWTNVM